MPQLQVLNGPHQWKSIPVSGPRFIIGRRKSCHLVLEDGWVSREHTVIIETKPGEFLVQDLGSENGSYLNNKRISEAPLKGLDVLRIGRTEMRFLLVNEAPEPAPEEKDTKGDEAPAEEWSETPAADQTVVGLRRPGDERRDVRERLRRYEHLVGQLEEDKRRLALENAVLKRAMAKAGLVNQDSGSLALERLQNMVPEMPHLVWPPRAHLHLPTPEGEPLEVGGPDARESVPGLLPFVPRPAEGARGVGLTEHLEELGYPNNAPSSGGAVLIDLVGSGEEIPRPDGPAEDLHGLWVEDAPDDEPVIRALETRAYAFALATCRERCAPREGECHPAAVGLDLVNRLAVAPEAVGQAGPWPGLRGWLAEARLGTLAMAATRADEVDPAALVKTALEQGCASRGAAPWSRARQGLVIVLDGRRESSSTEVKRLAGAVAEEVSGHMPQAQVHLVGHQDHARGVRLVIWAAGLPRLRRTGEAR